MKKLLQFKKTKLAMGIIAFSFALNVQAQNLTWAKKLGGTNDEIGKSVVVDAIGNVYTTGYFRGTVDFDPGVATFTLASAGDWDVYVSKLDMNGNFVWAKRFGSAGASDDQSFSISLDPLNNVYTTGYFRGTVDFDPGPGTMTLSSSGLRDFFISKLDAAGNFVWAQKIGGLGDDIANSIVVDASGDVYTSGYFSGTVDFDPGITTNTLSSVGSLDIFISKLDQFGNYVWAKQIGSGNADFGICITTDGVGNILTAGYFQGTADFDPGLSTFTMATAGSGDAFVIKLTNAGNFIFAKSLGGTGFDSIESIATDASNNIYTTGYFAGTADFDPSLNSFSLTSAGTDDVFVSKLDNAGNFVWAKKMGGSSAEVGHSIDVDASGNVYTAGSYNGTADFDPSATTNTLISSGANDIFVSKLDASGNYVWAKSIGNSGNDDAYGLTVDATGNVYTTGNFANTVDFDAGVGTYTLASFGGLSDVFVLKMGSCAANASPVNTTPVVNLTLCQNQSTTLTATGTGTVNWYASPNGTTIVNSGLSFTTPTLSAGSFSYYASTTNTCGAESGRTSFNLTINPLPTISVNSGTICFGNSFTIIPSGAINYTFQSGSAIVNPLLTSSYTVVGVNIFGCVSPSFATSHVTVKALPTINVVSSNPVICIGGTANLSATGGIAYFWTPGGSVPFISISPSVTTSYTVSGLGSNGCSGSSVFIQNVSLCDGIDQITDSGNKLSIFPNPSSAYITIKTEEAIQSISVVNAQGALVKTETINTFSVEELSSGIYFIKIKTLNGIGTTRFIKE
jgi:hypothetical protein